MAKVIYGLIGDTYYKIDQDTNVPDDCVKNIPNSVSYVERENLSELELRLNISTVSPNANSNREDCDIMKAMLRENTNIRSIDVISNHYKMKLTYTILDENRKVVDHSSTMRDVQPTDVLMTLGVNKYNEAQYRRAKLFSPCFRFMVRNIVPYGIMQKAKKSYTFLVNDISIYQEKASTICGENLHLSMYDNPYNVSSPFVNETLENALLIYSSQNEGIEYAPVTIGYVPRNVYVRVKILKDGYIGFYTESEILDILEQNKNKPFKYKNCESVITVSNRVELNQGVTPAVPELFNFVLESEDDMLPDEKNIIIAGYGSANFGSIVFEHPGVYTFKVRQIKGTNLLYSYSSEVFTVRITVSEHEYVLSAKTEVFNQHGMHCDKIEFTNYYGIEPAQYTFKLNNIVSGSEPLEKEKFNFILQSITANAPMPCKTMVDVIGAGEGKFENVEFTEPGVFEYAIYQVPGLTDNCIYDNGEYRVKVTAEKEYNHIALSVEITRDGEIAHDIVFNNSYIFKSAEIYVDFFNTIIGETPIIDEDFRYEFVPVTSNAPTIDNNVIILRGAGNAQFGPIEFFNPGVFVYQLYQIDQGSPNYIYDRNAYYAVITVVDNYGTLSAHVEYALNTVDHVISNIIFVNRYRVSDPTTALGATSHIITSGSNKPDLNGYMAMYEYCRSTNPHALTIVADNTPVEEYDDATMVPITCVLNDIPKAQPGESVIFTETISTT